MVSKLFFSLSYPSECLLVLSDHPLSDHYIIDYEKKINLKISVINYVEPFYYNSVTQQNPLYILNVDSF